MAERGAFLTSPAAPRPSVFEVLAQDSLANTVHPALRRLAAVAAGSSPDKLGWMVEWFDEIFLLLNFYVQKHYLHTCRASFAESFYGLRRSALGADALPATERRRSLACLVLLDYLARKAKARVEGWSERPDRAGLVRASRWLQAAWQSLSLAMLLGYMTGRLACHAPLLRVAGVGLQTAPDEPPPSRDLSHLSLPRRALAMVGPGLARGLEVGAFTLQFLQWWHSEGPRPQLAALPTPPPPQPLSGAEQYGGLCPVCLQERRIPTVLPVSGFVFCYRCIATQLSIEGRCPVTNLPAKQSHLVRLYATS